MADNDTGSMTDEQIAEQFPGQDVAHIRAMVDKMDGKGVPADPNADGGETNGEKGGEPQAATEYPDWIPEKFRSGTVDEAMQKLAESYSVLEGNRGSPAAGDSGDADGAAGSDDGAGDAPAGDDAAPLNLAAAESEFVKDGKLSAATYEAAEKAGMSPEVLDAYIAGQQAIANQMVTKVHDAAGGPENYEAMLQWAIGNLPKAEVEAYDAAMSSGREANIMLAVRGLKASYVDAVGQLPQRTLKGDSGGRQAEGFQSKREMIDAMKDPRYAKDPAYRKDVERRIANGNVW